MGRKYHHIKRFNESETSIPGSLNDIVNIARDEEYQTSIQSTTYNIAGIHQISKSRKSYINQVVITKPDDNTRSTNSKFLSVISEIQDRISNEYQIDSVSVVYKHQYPSTRDANYFPQFKIYGGRNGVKYIKDFTPLQKLNIHKVKIDVIDDSKQQDYDYIYENNIDADIVTEINDVLNILKDEEVHIYTKEEEEDFDDYYVYTVEISNNTIYPLQHNGRGKYSDMGHWNGIIDSEKFMRLLTEVLQRLNTSDSTDVYIDYISGTLWSYYDGMENQEILFKYYDNNGTSQPPKTMLYDKDGKILKQIRSPKICYTVDNIDEWDITAIREINLKVYPND